MSSVTAGKRVRADPAEPIPDEKWDLYKPTISALYMNQRLEDVMKVMESQHGFKATKAQYTSQLSTWGVQKNAKRKQAPSICSQDTIDTQREPPNLRPGAFTPFVQGPMSDSLFTGMNPATMAMPNPYQDQYAPSAYMNGPGYQTDYSAFGPPDQNLLLFSVNNGLGPANSSSSQHFNYSFQPGQPIARGHPPAAQANHHYSINSNRVIRPSRNASSTANVANATSLNTTNAEPKTYAIHLAVHSGNLRAAKHLLDAKPECAHLLDRKGITPAYLAAEGGHADVLKLLMSYKVDLNTKENEDLRCPLHQAAQAGHTGIGKLLLDNGAEPDPVDKWGTTPLWSAAQNGHYDFVQILFDKAREKNIRLNVEAESEDGERRPIHQAAQQGYDNIVQLLLDNGATYDPVDKHGITPLWSAAQNGHTKVVSLLIAAGAKRTVTPYENNRQPIHQAAMSGHLEVVQLLLEAGVSPSPEEDSFEDSEPSPFLLACGSGKVDMVKLFLEKKDDLHRTALRNGRRALHYAAAKGNVDVGRFLVEKGCDVDSRESEGWSPLMLAAQDGHLGFVSLLLDHNSNPNSEDNKGATALVVAAQNGHDKILKRLFEAGARQLANNDGRRRPIHQAAQNGHLACVRLLLKHSPEEINKKDKEGMTALALASLTNKPGQLSVVRYLLDRGAEVM